MKFSVALDLQGPAQCRSWTDTEEWNCKDIQTVDLFSGTNLLYFRKLCDCSVKRRVVTGVGRNSWPKFIKCTQQSKMPSYPEQCIPGASEPNLTSREDWGKRKSSMDRDWGSVNHPFPSFSTRCILQISTFLTSWSQSASRMRTGFQVETNYYQRWLF